MNTLKRLLLYARNLIDKVINKIDPTQPKIVYTADTTAYMGSTYVDPSEACMSFTATNDVSGNTITYGTASNEQG